MPMEVVNHCGHVFSDCIAQIWLPDAGCFLSHLPPS